MRRALLRNLSLYTRNPLPVYKSNPTKLIPFSTPLLSSISSPSSKLRFFSSQNDDSSTQNPNPAPESSLVKSEASQLAADVEDVSNKELKEMIEKYTKGDEEVLPEIFEAILKRKIIGKHEETDDELLDEFQMKPIDDVNDKDFESDFEDAHETDEEIDDLYDAMGTIRNKMMKDPYYNMDDKKWDDMVREGIEHGFLKNTRECEEILEDMLSWDKLLPDKIKKKVEKKFDKIADMIERGEVDEEEGYRLFKEYEDKMVLECAELMEKEGPPQFDETETPPDTKKDSDDPPGEGPILRWQTRCVFAPGGDAWHPKNRKVKMAVTVKELGLSKHQFRRLRELVGKRYNPGKDELMITSERFEHREENRKDCLRTLFAIIEEAGKANKMVEESLTSYVKDRLRANPQFMERLQAKAKKTGQSSSVPA